MAKITDQDIKKFKASRQIEIQFIKEKPSNDFLHDLVVMQMMNQEEMSPEHRIVSCKLVIEPIISEKTKRIRKAYEELGDRWERYQTGTKNYHPEDMQEEDLLKDIRFFSEIKKGISLSDF